MNQCSQTRISRGFTLIVDDSGHRKSGNFTAGVGRQYIGEIGKTDNGIVVVTTHLYDGKKSLPLDIELYQHASSLPQGKKDLGFKTEALEAFRTAMSFRFIEWLNHNRDVFFAYKAALGFVWA